MKFSVSILSFCLISASCAPIKKGKTSQAQYTPFDDTRTTTWADDFKLVDIKQNGDSNVQKAYFYQARSKKPRPLVVSLHTWSGDYAQRDDEIANLCRTHDLNYIHPDFRGANNTANACCSELALSDIDDAIGYAISNAKVDREDIYVVGVSGGGYATLSFFMRSKHRIRSFSAWASISDLVAWYQESRDRKRKYADDILKCTMSEDGQLNIAKAKAKSPLYWKTPVEKVSSAKLFIHAGIHDGYKGSVPISHSIDFYNKILSDCGATDSSNFVTTSERSSLLKQIPPAGVIGDIGGRKLYLEKHYKNVTLMIFEGGHEMLFDTALKELTGE
jgi:pimeloyl-ACP methyl ester carboxylesterase